MASTVPFEALSTTSFTLNILDNRFKISANSTHFMSDPDDIIWEFWDAVLNIKPAAGSSD
jgi:hypothetical protein